MLLYPRKADVLQDLHCLHKCPMVNDTRHTLYQWLTYRAGIMSRSLHSVERQFRWGVYGNFHWNSTGVIGYTKLSASIFFIVFSSSWFCFCQFCWCQRDLLLHSFHSPNANEASFSDCASYEDFFEKGFSSDESEVVFFITRQYLYKRSAKYWSISESSTSCLMMLLERFWTHSDWWYQNPTWCLSICDIGGLQQSMMALKCWTCAPQLEKNFGIWFWSVTRPKLFSFVHRHWCCNAFPLTKKTFWHLWAAFIDVLPDTRRTALENKLLAALWKGTNYTDFVAVWDSNTNQLQNLSAGFLVQKLGSTFCSKTTFVLWLPKPFPECRSIQWVFRVSKTCFCFLF